MTCENGRVRVSDGAKFRLFADCAGHCQNPQCARYLFVDLADDTIHIAEMAHVVAATEGGPRGKAVVLDLDERANYDNIIVLCPTCHVTVDKAPERFPVDELLRWKSEHVGRVKAALGVVRYNTREAARTRIEPLLTQNRQIHADYGPEAPGASHPESEMPRAWQRKLVETVIPNNYTILAVVDANRQLLTEDEKPVVEKLRQHVDDLAARHILGLKEPYRARFPEGAEDLLR